MLTYGKICNIISTLTFQEERTSIMRKFLSIVLASLMVFSVVLIFPAAEESNDYTDILDKKVTNPEYVLDVSTEEQYVPGETIYVTISARDIKPEGGIEYIQLKLYYDKTKVEPVILNDETGFNKAMESFLTKAPNRETWEGINKLQEELSRYYISFVSIKDYAKDDGSLVIKVPFKVKSSATGTIAFQVPHKETVATNLEMQDILGNAGMAVSDPKLPPPAPTLLYKGKDSVVLWQYDCCEYRTEGGEWQNSTKFTGLLPNKTYKFYTREIRSYPEELTPESKAFIVTLDGTCISLNSNFENSEKNYVTGFKDELTVKDIEAVIGKSVEIKDTRGNVITNDSFVGTGSVMRYYGMDYKFIIKGDASGDGKINSKDYLLVKRAFLKTHNLSEVQNKAACLEENAISPTSKDYLKIKRYFLKTYNLYE